MSASKFEIIPAIDLIDGKAVRLSQGDYSKKTVYSNNPLDLAKGFEDAGIRRLHLVDLDGAKVGSIKNHAILEEIAGKTGLQVDFGGGVSSRSDVENVLNSGAAMVALGSVAVKKPELFAEWISEFGPEVFFLGADVKNEKLAVKGWTEITSVSIFDFLQRQIEQGITRIFCTDIAMDGMLTGPSVGLYKALLAKFPALSLTASGGVSGVSDLELLKDAGCSGVIVGKAIYEQRITLQDLTPFLN